MVDILEQYLKPADEQNTNKEPGESQQVPSHQQQQQKLPNGVVLGPDGKPCRTCTTASEWRNLVRMTRGGNATTGQTANGQTAEITKPQQQLETGRADCPPDVEELGRSSWTLLHTMAAFYPDKANAQQQSDMSSFLKYFSRLYPCWVCANDFQDWMGKTPPPLETRDDFGNWMCKAHNVVNLKLGKKEFDCSRWQERWKDGWKDGRCD